MKDFQGTRYPAVADQFYPGSPDKLKKMIADYLSASDGGYDPAVRALIAPHAGYVYSGATAAAGYGLLVGRDDIERVVVLAPSHRCAFRGASFGSHAAFNTPLGDLPVDVDACRRLLAASPLFSQRDDAHADEHALEVQLPFIQQTLGAINLVPVVCGFVDDAESKILGELLAEHFWREDSLWVVSSDFTHYGDAFGYKPFARDAERNLRELDQGAIRHILDKNFVGFMSYVEETGATVCGRTPIAVLLAALRAKAPRATCELLAYTTSGHLTRDFSHSVSYATIAVRERQNPVDHQTTANDRADLPAGEKAFLLNLAREAIHAKLYGEAFMSPAEDQVPTTLTKPGAAFVSLHLDGALRGCIGNLEAEEPLYLNVVHNAVNAAFRDPRFRPLDQEEYERLEIEISVLTRPRRIASLDEFVIGRHGIILSKRGRRAVFLPQVASEQGWDVETTMTHLALKAGLRPDDWQRDATYEIFEAIIFATPRRHPMGCSPTA